MFKWLGIGVCTLRSVFRARRELALENLVLRQQLATFKHQHPRPQLTDADRLFWVWLSSIWSGWRSSLHIVQPDTVVRWHRQGFRYYWRWKSRPRGRPKIDPEIRDLILRMCQANPLWGAPRIHGELLKLGIEISEATVSKYMIRRRGPPSQTWRTFLENHATELIALDFFTVPTAAWTGRQLLEACGFEETPLYLVRDRDAIYGEEFRRQAAALRIEEILIAPRSPWQNPYAERVIGSIRRECVNHLVVLGERHLRQVLSSYVGYYNGTRTHLSLDKDAPEGRTTQHPERGKVIARKRVGGLHHEYLRMAA